jgi:uncharacterized membrane protein HdeD (DUF308 family)
MDNKTQVVGVVIALVFITICSAAILYFTRKLIAQDKILFLLIFLVTLLACSWAVDNIIAIHMNLLDDEENKTILQIMSNVVSLVLGYYMRGGEKNDLKS